MSIAPNVGALSRYFNRVRLNPQLWHAREGVEERLTELPGGIGAALRAPRPAAQGVDQGLLGARPVVGGARLGLHGRRRRPRRARAARARCARRSPPSRPVVVHIATVKGKGFAPAEEGGLEGMEKWHAAKPKSIANGAPRPPPSPRRRRQAGPAAVHEGLRRGAGRRVRRDRRVVGITAAMNSGTGLNILQKAMPEPLLRRRHRRAAGDPVRRRASRCRACKPVAAIYSTFLQRAYDQIVHDVCLQKLNVVVRDGPRRPRRRRRPDAPRRLRHRLPALPAQHRADRAARRGEARAHAAHRAACTTARRAALPARRGRRRARCSTRRASRRWRSARGEMLREGDGRVALLGYGSGVAQGARRRRTCSRERGLDATVADARFAKPLDAGARRPARRRARAARHRRGGRARGRLRLRGLGGAERRPASTSRGSCASACPTATSRTASPRCCTPRSGSPARRSPQRIEAAVGQGHGSALAGA